MDSFRIFMEGHKKNKQSAGYSRRAPARTKPRVGFTLLEMLITIGVVSILLMVMMSVTNIANLQRNTYYQAVARQLLAEEGEALRNASFLDLGNRSNTGFIEVAYNSGSWAVENSGSAFSLPNVYGVASASGAANPSRQVVPAGKLGDGSYGVAVRINPAATPGWKAGFAIRYHDDQNYYLLRMAENELAFVRVNEGVATTLWSVAQTFNPNVWYQLAVSVTGSSFTISVDGTTRSVSPIIDTTFFEGQFVLVAQDGAVADFDSVSYAGLVSLNWNFDSGETLGTVAKGWKRIGPKDLPAGATSITISNAVVSATDLKRISVQVQWYDHGATRKLSNEFYINQRSVAP